MPRDPIEMLDTSEAVSPALHLVDATPSRPNKPGVRAVSRMPDGANATPSTLGVLTYNILAGGSTRLNLIEAVIRDSGADLIGLQEVRRPDLLALLAERLGMHHAIAIAPGGWNVGILSRWPILTTRSSEVDDVPRGLLEVLVRRPDGRRVRLFVTHLSAGFRLRGAGEEQRLREMAYVLKRMRTTRTANEWQESQILVGDFNSLAPGERLRATEVLRHALAADTSRRVHGHALKGHPSVDFILPPLARPFRGLLTLATSVPPLAWACDLLAGAYVPRRVVRRVRAVGYTDCYAAKHPDPRARAFSCPAQAPAGRIDYIFASPTLAEHLVSCEVLTDTPARPVDRASDHRPVLARFVLPEG